MSDILRCWSRLQNKIDNESKFVHPDVPKKFEFIRSIINGDKVDTSEYTHLELIGFIDHVTKSVNIDKSDWPLITSIILRVNACYRDADNSVNTTEDISNSSREAQKELLKIVRDIYYMSDEIKYNMFGTHQFYTIISLDPDDIITKYNNYIKSTDYKIGDEICMKNNLNIKGWITKIYIHDFDCLFNDGSVRCISKTDCDKTGRHNVSLGATLANNMEDCIILEDVNNE